jgi:phage baseplate assembly protein W
MIDVSRGTVAVLKDNESIVNRCRLLILTEENEMYNSPEFGVGLKRHLWKYNNENEKAIIRDRITEKLRMYEPCCIPEKTEYADGLLYTESEDTPADVNKLKMSIIIYTIYGDNLNVNLSDLQEVIESVDRKFSV